MLSRNFGNIHGRKSLHDSADALPSSHHCCCGWLGSKASIYSISTVYQDTWIVHIIQVKLPCCIDRFIAFICTSKFDAENGRRAAGNQNWNWEVNVQKVDTFGFTSHISMNGFTVGMHMNFKYIYIGSSGTWFLRLINDICSIPHALTPMLRHAWPT